MPHPPHFQVRDQALNETIRYSYELANQLLNTKIWIETAPGLPPFLHFLLDLTDRKVDDAWREEQTPHQVWLRINSPRGLGKANSDILHERLAALPPSILERLCKGQSSLVLDYSHEGRRVERDVPFKYIENTLKKFRFPAGSTYILTQNLAATRQKFTDQRVSIPVHAHSHTAHLWLYSVLASPDQVIPPVGFAINSPGERPHHFICLNYHLRPLRALIVARLLQCAQPGFISFSIDRKRTASAHLDLLEGVRARSVSTMADANVAIVRDLLSQKIEMKSDASDFKSARQAVYSFPELEFKKSNLFIVTESEMEDGYLIRFTEKTVKAIISGLPFIVFGNFQTIATLREIGFDVLDDIINHQYDELPDPAARFEAAWAEVQRCLQHGPNLVRDLEHRLVAASTTNASVFNNNVPRSWLLPTLEALCTLSTSISAHHRNVNA